MFLSQSIDFLDMLYYEKDAFHSSFALFYYVLSLVVILMMVVLIVMLMMMMVIRSSSITCCHLSCKIRFEAPKRQREEEEKKGEKKVKEGKYRYFNSAQR
jgi:hypothetical protein